MLYCLLFSFLLSTFLLFFLYYFHLFLLFLILCNIALFADILLTPICFVLYCLIYSFTSSFILLFLLFIGALDLFFNPIITSSINFFFHKYIADRLTLKLSFTYSNPHLSYIYIINIFSCSSFVSSSNTLNVLTAVIIPFPYLLLFCCISNPISTSFY